MSSVFYDNVVWGDQFSDANEVLNGTDQRDFIHGFAGDDAINGGAGDDIIDGGLGSNFLVGGAGVDRFFLDGRGSFFGADPTWSTIVDFGQYETVSIVGWNYGLTEPGYVGGRSQIIDIIQNGGTAGYTGLTYHLDINGDGQIDSSLTLTGLTSTDQIIYL